MAWSFLNGFGKTPSGLTAELWLIVKSLLSTGRMTKADAIETKELPADLTAELPLDDEGLQELLQRSQDPDDGWVADAPEILTFARLALAANEATRRDCPLWLVG